MATTTQEEREELRQWASDGTIPDLSFEEQRLITNTIKDADHLQRAEKLLREARGFVSVAELLRENVGTLPERIDAYFGESHD